MLTVHSGGCRLLVDLVLRRELVTPRAPGLPRVAGLTPCTTTLLAPTLPPP